MKKYAFGVDIGGTAVKIGLFSSEGDLLDRWEIGTNTADHGRHVIPDLAAELEKKLASEHLTKDDIAGVGAGVPGPVNAEGIILNCANLGWGTFHLEEELSRQTGLFCKAGNDANVAALGEMYRGVGAGYKNLVMITLGTGVGGGVIINGKIVPGACGAAGEIGHMPVNEDETAVCGCGRKGCLEQYASAKGIARVAKLCLAESDEETVLRRTDHVTAKDIFDAAKEGDAFAARMVETLGKTLGMACARIAAAIDPEAFVIGGGVSGAGSILTDVIEKYYKQYAFHAVRETKILLAKLGNDAGIYGGARLILDQGI